MCQLVAGVNCSSLNIKIICGVGMGCERALKVKTSSLCLKWQKSSS